MGNDSDGSKYRSLIKEANSREATRGGLMPALSYLAKMLGKDSTTESTVAVGYWDRYIYIAKLGRVTKPLGMIEEVNTLFYAPLDEKTEAIFSPLEDHSDYPVSDVSGVGGGKTGLHAEMMLIQEYHRQKNTVSAWGSENLNGIYIAASQGACPGCAGFMNLRQINHTGVRVNGRVSQRWINPIDGTFCGTESGSGLSFSDITVSKNCQWGG